MNKYKQQHNQTIQLNRETKTRQFLAASPNTETKNEEIDEKNKQKTEQINEGISKNLNK